MPQIDEINSLLSRLGIIVDILEVDDYFVVVGSEYNVARAKELISKLVEAIGEDPESKETVFELSTIESKDSQVLVRSSQALGSMLGCLNPLPGSL